MKNSTKVAISLIALAAMPFLAGCGPSMANTPVTEVSSTQTSSRQAVIVQPAPAVVSHSTTTTTTQTTN
jgi:hypothetical protein